MSYVKAPNMPSATKRGYPQLSRRKGEMAPVFVEGGKHRANLAIIIMITVILDSAMAGDKV